MRLINRLKVSIRIITIMSTMKAHNLCVYSMMQKRDFLNHDTDKNCQKKVFNIPFCLKKGGSFPILACFEAIFAHSIQGDAA